MQASHSEYSYLEAAARAIAFLCRVANVATLLLCSWESLTTQTSSNNCFFWTLGEPLLSCMRDAIFLSRGAGSDRRFSLPGLPRVITSDHGPTALRQASQ